MVLKEVVNWHLNGFRNTYNLLKMDYNLLRPEIRKIIRFTPRIPWHNPSLFPLSRLLYNMAAKTKVAKDVTTSEVVFDGLEMLIYSPKNYQPTRAILWMFGGGHLAGKPSHLNAIASEAVNKIGVEVVVPNYRLAPKHPFPADLDDCFKAWNWLVDKGESRGIEIHKLILAGNSAGAGIATALAQRILDTGGIQPVAQCLFYPMIDDRVAAKRSLDKVNHFIWNNKANLAAWNAYLGKYNAGDENVPEYAAPARRKSLKGLPATWMGHCELDLFAEEYAAYSERLQLDGVECENFYAKGVPHAFELFIPESEVAKNFVGSAINFLKKTSS